MSEKEAFAVGERMRAAVALAAAAGAVGFVYLVDPSASAAYPTCPFLALTGCLCPGCGSLRALHEITHGHPGEALGLNPLMVLLLPPIAYSFASVFALAVTGRTLRKVFVEPGLIWALLGCILLFGVLRNVPFYPLSALAP